MHAAHVTTSVIIHSESTIWIIKLLFWIGDKFTLFTEFSRHKQSSSKCHAWLYHLSSCSREWVFQQELHQRQHRWVYETCLTWCHQQAQEWSFPFQKLPSCSTWIHRGVYEGILFPTAVTTWNWTFYTHVTPHCHDFCASTFNWEVMFWINWHYLKTKWCALISESNYIPASSGMLFYFT